MEFFICKLDVRKNDITYKSKPTLDTKGVKGFPPKADPPMAEIRANP